MDTLQDAFASGFRDGIEGLVTGVTYDNDPDSPRSREYDRGRTIAERHIEAFGDEHDEDCPLCGLWEDTSI